MKLIVANFKMNLLNEDINSYIKEIKNNHLENVVFCPSNIYLKDFIGEGLNTGSQSVAFQEKGAYTGEISALQLKSIGVQYAIVGHSERRMLFNDDNYVNDKLKMCLNNDIIPIVCIGEKEEEKNIKEDILINQINIVFNGVNNLEKVIIAYEPIWAIGTGLIPTNQEIEDTITFIKRYIKEKYNFNIKVLYGGSINNKNINILEQVNNLDGYLVGGSSLNANDFNDLISQVK